MKKDLYAATKNSRVTYRKELKRSRLYWVGLAIALVGIILLFTVVGTIVGVILMVVGLLFCAIAKIRTAKKKIY